MPSKSQAQHNLMAAVAHGWKPSDVPAPPVKVAKEFAAADEGKRKMARGGPVKPYRIAAEDEHHIAIHHDGEERPFRVAKKGLSAKTLERIRKMARGGEMKGYADGGVVLSGGPSGGTPDAPMTAPASGGEWVDTDKLTPAEAKDAGGGSLTVQSLSPEQRERLLNAPGTSGEWVDTEKMTPEEARDAGAGKLTAESLTEEQRQRLLGPDRPADVARPGGAFHEALAGASGPVQLEHPDGTKATVVPAGTPDLGGYRGPVTDLGRVRDLVGQLDAEKQAAAQGVSMPKRPFVPSLPQPAAPVSAPVPPRPAPAVPSPAMPAAPDALTTGEAEQRAGIMKRAGAEADLATRRVAIQDQYLAERKRLEDEGNAKMAALQRRTDALRQDILNSKIDPSAHWQGMGTGARVGSIIGMILGGIGAASTGGRNLAVEAMDKAIERDVDAQKANLGKKQSLLATYMQEGHDLQSALQLAKADKMEMAAAQLEREAARASGPVAQANAQMALGQLRQQSQALRQEAVHRDLANRAASLGIKATEQQMALNEAMRQQLSAGEGGMMGVARMAVMTDPKKVAEHLVRVPTRVQVSARGPNGEPQYTMASIDALATSPADKTKATEAMEGYQEQQGKLAQLEAFARQHPYGTWSAKERERAADLVSDFGLSFNRSQEGLNRLTDTELGLANQLTRNPADVLPAIFGKTAVSFGTLRNMIEAKRQAVIDTRLFPDPRLERHRWRPPPQQ